jgi:hypothetical protein
VRPSARPAHALLLQPHDRDPQGILGADLLMEDQGAGALLADLLRCIIALTL